MHKQVVGRYAGSPAFAALVSALLLSGCASTMRNRQLQDVAKDWSMVIRASQVIPVYPLTEDLQPGDVMLVSLPVENQSALYKKRGFLPLDQLMVRLYPTNYPEFYRTGYEITDSELPPRNWQKNHSWTNAPRAAFPSYNFSVTAKTGMGLAIPVQGVPVAMGLMNTGTASGSVLINKAFTYGMDTYRLEEQVRDWALDNRALLRNYEQLRSKNGKICSQHYLRVVSRVYAAGGVNITVNKGNEASGSVAGGNAQNSLLQQTDATNYVSTLKALNGAAELLPGGKVSFSSISSRTVSMDEAFDRPLVVGYVGFDLPILQGGRLGAPISTLAQLEDMSPYPAESSPAKSLYVRAALKQVYTELESVQSEAAQEIKRAVDELASRLLPEKYEFTVYESANESGTEIKPVKNCRMGDNLPPGKSMSQLLNYISQTEETKKAIVDAGLQKTAPYEDQFRLAAQTYDRCTEALSGHPAVIRMVDYVFFGY
jgi:hypothetical protein